MQIQKIAPNRYHLDVAIKKGGRKRETFEGTIYEARTRVFELKKELKAQQVGKRSLTSFKTFGDVLQYYWDYKFQYLKWSKSASYLYRTLFKEFGQVSMDQLTVERFEDWLTERSRIRTRLGKLPQPESLNKFITVAKGAFNFLIQRRLFDKNPLHHIRKRPTNNIQRRIISPEEFQKIYHGIPEYLRPMFHFIYTVPSRKSEIVRLENPRHLHLSEGYLELEDANSKTGVGRILPIPKSMMSYFQNLPKESPWIFYRPENKPDGTITYHQLNGNVMLHLIRRLHRRLEMKPFILHDFRRTSAVRLIEAGVDLKTVCDIGGWRDVKTVCERYLHLTPRHLQKSLDRVDTWLTLEPSNEKKDLPITQ